MPRHPHSPAYKVSPGRTPCSQTLAASPFLPRAATFSFFSTSFSFLLPSHTHAQPEEVFDGELPWTPRRASRGGGACGRRRNARDRSRTRDLPPLFPLLRADAYCLRLHVAIVYLGPICDADAFGEHTAAGLLFPSPSCSGCRRRAHRSPPSAAAHHRHRHELGLVELVLQSVRPHTLAAPARTSSHTSPAPCTLACCTLGFHFVRMNHQ